MKRKVEVFAREMLREEIRVVVGTIGQVVFVVVVTFYNIFVILLNYYNYYSFLI